MRKNTPNYHTYVFVPTLTDVDGLCHIIPGRNRAPYCGAPQEGTQEAPMEHRRDTLCQRCAQKYIKAVYSDEASR